jgi:hypothetical protein
MDALNSVMLTLDDAFHRLDGTSEGTLSCPLGGMVAIAGRAMEPGAETASNFTVDATVTFDACHGLEGSLSLAGQGTFDGSTLRQEMVLTGTVDHVCLLHLDQLILSITVDDATGDVLAGTVDGLLVAQCSDAAISCIWHDANFLDTAALRAECR